MQRLLRALAVGVVGAGVFVTLHCGDAVSALDNGARCSLNSDCKDPLVCGFERCRTQCLTSRDCGGKLCVRGDKVSGANVCQLEDEIECTHNSQCPGTQVCASDRRCRDVCVTDKDCLTDLLCVSRVCAKPDELVKGALPNRNASDAGVRCTYATDCPGELVCLYGLCDLECLGDKDCRVGWSCHLATQGGDGRCYPNGFASDASRSDANLGDGGVSLDGAPDDGGTSDAGDGSDGAGPPPSSLKGIAAGHDHSCALFGAGKVKCWGGNTYGQLGLGDFQSRGDGPSEMGDNLPYVDLGTGRSAKAIAAGFVHTCAILDNDKVKCWGQNSGGQLGLGDVNPRGDGAGEMGDNLPYVDLGTGRTAKAITAGLDDTCAILDNDRVKCWGTNTNGKLGIGDTSTRGDGAGEMGDSLPYVDLGTGRTAKAIVAKEFHTCAILDNDQVKCWGDNSAGELGLGNKVAHGSGAGQMGDALLAADLGTARFAKAISGGSGMTCVLLDNDKVKCWGLNSSGQLGLGDTSARGDGAGEMGDALSFVDLGTGRTAKAIAGENAHTCVVLDNDKVKCWGYNGVGNLGLGDMSTHGAGAGQMGDALPSVDLGTGRTALRLAAGYGHLCAGLDDDSLKCWGNNTFGGLGLGDFVTRGDGPNEMGDKLPAVKLVGP